MYEKGNAYIGKAWWGDQKGKQVAQLPHMCDEWVIGGVKEIDELIADLTEIRKQLEKQDDN